MDRKALPRGSVVAALRRFAGCTTGGLAVLFFLATHSIVVGQQDDSSELFLKAYLSAQQAEKLEHQSRFKSALAKFRFAGSLIEELRRSHSGWQPAVVEYRGRKISEGILRLQQRMTTHTQLNAGASSLPEIAPVAPESDAWSEPGPELLTPQRDEIRSDKLPDITMSDSTKKLRHKVDQLQAALDRTRSDLDSARKEREAVDTRLKETDSKMEQAQTDLDQAKKSERESRDQLTKIRESTQNSKTLDANDDAEQEQLRTQIAELKQAVATADEARLAAEKQRDETQARFVETSTANIAIGQERDDALSHLKSAKDTERHLQALVAEKIDLQQRLTSAEERVQKFVEAGPQRADELAEMRQEMAQLQQQLNETKNGNDYLVARSAELDVELEHTSADLQAAKRAIADNEESDQLARENELLRNIIVRERQEEARRDQARKAVIAQMDKLNVRSDLLNKNLEFLAQPLTKLSTEELALFRRPVISVSDEKPGVFRANFVFEKKSFSSVVVPANSDATVTSAAKTAASDLPEVARAASENVEPGGYRRAEK